MHIKSEVVQCMCSDVTCEGRIAYQVPAGMKRNGLVFSWLGAIVEESRVSWLGNMDPKAHGFVQFGKVVSIGFVN